MQVRSDSAAYDQAVLDHWDERGWRFAVSADMTPQLRAAIVDLAPAAWQFWAEEPSGFVREWAEVAYVPSRVPERRDSQPYRYLAIRIRPPQGVFFGDGTWVKHFAVVTNDWEEEGQKLLEWHRGKAGTIEQVHRVLKDELAAGVYLSARFGANAAWLRLQVLTFNRSAELTAKPAGATEGGGAGFPVPDARPKRLRFAIFTQFGRVVRHAHRQLVRLANLAWEALVVPGRRRIAALVWPTT